MKRLQHRVQIHNHIQEIMSKEQKDNLVAESIKADMGRALEIPIKYERSPNDVQYASTEVFYLTRAEYDELLSLVHRKLTPKAQSLLKPLLGLD